MDTLYMQVHSLQHRPKQRTSCASGLYMRVHCRRAQELHSRHDHAHFSDDNGTDQSQKFLHHTKIADSSMLLTIMHLTIKATA